jgi:hypothetical protein
LLQEQSKALVKAGAVPTGDALLPPIGGDADPRELLRIAVESRDPEVLHEIGSLQGMLNPSQSAPDEHLNHIAWLYIACQRGFDCSGYGNPVEQPCAPSASPCERVPARLITMARYNWAPVQERVNELNAALDANQWDQLGLGP